MRPKKIGLEPDGEGYIFGRQKQIQQRSLQEINLIGFGF